MAAYPDPQTRGPLSVQPRMVPATAMARCARTLARAVRRHAGAREEA